MPRKSAAKVELIVTVAESHHKQIADVAGRLKTAGMTGVKTLHGAGIITGRAAAAALPKLGKVAGVQAVEHSGEVQIAPPESDIQ